MTSGFVLVGNVHVTGQLVVEEQFEAFVVAKANVLPFWEAVPDRVMSPDAPAAVEVRLTTPPVEVAVTLRTEELALIAETNAEATSVAVSLPLEVATETLMFELLIATVSVPTLVGLPVIVIVPVAVWAPVDIVAPQLEALVTLTLFASRRT